MRLESPVASCLCVVSGAKPRLGGAQQQGHGDWFWKVYWFPVAVVINVHKFSDFKQHTFTTSHFWKSETPTPLHRMKPGCQLVGWSSGSSRGESVSLPFPVSVGHLHSSTQGFFLHLQSPQCSVAFLDLTWIL